MNIKSLRLRLIVWYFSAFFLSALIIFLVFYSLTKKILYEQTDKEITLHSLGISEVILRNSSAISSDFLKSELNYEFTQIPGMLVVVADKNGKIITSSQPNNSNISIISDVLNKSYEIIKSVYINRTIGTAKMRLSISHTTDRNYIIIVGHPIGAIENSLNQLVEILIWTLIILGMLSILVGFFIAKNALIPIKALSLKLKNISSTSLNQQIENPKTGDELEELSLTFNSLLERLNNAFVRERQFIGDIAHELKTPLSTLKNTIEVAMSKNRSAKDYQGTLSNTLIDIDNLSSTINDVLDLAWAESDNIIIKDKVNLSTLLVEIEELLLKMAENKKINISSEITKGVIIVGNGQKLFRALFNLIDNAVKYTPENGKIALILEKEQEEIIIEITNTGKGIKKEDMPYIFNRFYRGTKDSKVFGSGLGLAICKSIIVAHKGTISIASLPHKLTTLKIVFSNSVSLRA